MGMTRTTLTLPADLLAEVDQAVRSGKVRSRNAFVADAIRHALAAAEEEAIDAAFAGMATDLDYQAETNALTNEFAHADWEAFRQRLLAPRPRVCHDHS